MLRFPRAIAAVLILLLRTITYGWIARLVEVVRALCAGLRARRERCLGPGRHRKSSPDPCVGISDPAYKRPDPLIYSQQYLMKQGLAVTWNNPDIELRRGGVVVSSSDLAADTEYEIVARIWNNSTEAPVVGLPVKVSYLSFGAGTQSHAIGSTNVSLGVKGGPNHPAFATVPWRTPAQPGHYCIQVLLDWLDDVNPDNNLGQENTNVGKAQSPATFEFQLRNDTRERQRFRFEVDTYELPPRDPCAAKERPRRERQHREQPGTVYAVPPKHDRSNYPVPAGWTVTLTASEPSLAAGDEVTIKAVINPPDTFTGRQAFNINAFHQQGLAGGVTLYVERP